MRRQPESTEKPLYWVEASKHDLLTMPEPVIRHFGSALGVAYYGGKHPDATPWICSSLLPKEIAEWSAHGEDGREFD